MFPAEGEKKQLEILRKMTPSKRIKIGFELNQLAYKLMLGGIKKQFPHLSKLGLKKQIALRLGQ